MTSFTQDEVISATDVVRNFSSELKSLTSGEKEKLVIVKNNRFEAVIIPIEEYERMSEAVKILEKIYKKTKPNGA
ncbi:MAG TPA: type II toxin-antitoxin system Phd/YefM family antitoxin [Sulfurospirillum arcachonense]|jgi:prevent-host-death family protein|nr:type II toxin-antitoxin system Phd/YefM family antitoxin [Sulfurospirillum arcachonense]HIP44641.1 type II toxin-antitoxin system Phd/YefM family antitoxin [Sulfurospirillum arcachonense]